MAALGLRILTHSCPFVHAATACFLTPVTQCPASRRQCPASRRQCNSKSNLARPPNQLKLLQFQQSGGAACIAGAAQPGASAVLQMDEDVRQLVLRIHDSPVQAVLYAAGGGLQAFNWLLTTPGASRTVLDARVPYSQAAMSELLGSAPATFASVETAGAMAAAAYRAAANLASFGTPVVGLGCSCALVTDRQKRGAHKVVVATHTGTASAQWAVTLEKGARDRGQEDAVASRLLLGALAQASGLGPDTLDSGLQEGHDGELQVGKDEQIAEPLHALLSGKARTVEFSGGQVLVDAPRRGRVYLPGSFNPLHDGHRKLLQAGCRAASGRAGCYEMTIGHPDKGHLPLEEVQRRLQPFLESGDPVVVTQAPLYSDKAQLFLDATFVVGYDTAIRLIDDKYYGGSEGTVLSMAALRYRGCLILVAGRIAGSSQGDNSSESPGFLTLHDIHLSEALMSLGLFQEIPETDFRQDISSTQLRRQVQKQAPQ